MGHLDSKAKSIVEEYSTEEGIASPLGTTSFPAIRRLVLMGVAITDCELIFLVPDILISNISC